MRATLLRRRVVALCGATMVLAALSVLHPPVASADPAGPSNFVGEVVGIEPGIDGVSARVVGADSFVELTVASSEPLTVIGYRGENFLRFEPDGGVHENLNSPTVYLSRERYGGNEIVPDRISDSVDPKSLPAEWSRVGEDGRYAWHDHRAHWMNESDPVGVDEGDQVIDTRIPLRSGDAADGGSADSSVRMTAEIVVQSRWIGPPSAVPPLAGLLMGAALVIGGGVADARGGHTSRRWLTAVLAAASLAALWIGVSEWIELPPEARGSPVMWIIPAASVVAVALSAIGTRNVLGRRVTRPTLDGLLALAAMELVVWSLLRADYFGASVLPTASGGAAGFVRFLSGAVLAGAVGCSILILREFRRPVPHGSP